MNVGSSLRTDISLGLNPLLSCEFDMLVFLFTIEFLLAFVYFMLVKFKSIFVFVKLDTNEEAGEGD